MTCPKCSLDFEQRLSMVRLDSDFYCDSLTCIACGTVLAIKPKTYPPSSRTGKEREYNYGARCKCGRKIAPDSPHDKCYVCRNFKPCPGCGKPISKNNNTCINCKPKKELKGTGRTCAHPGCKTELSRTTREGGKCFKHSRKRVGEC